MGHVWMELKTLAAGVMLVIQEIYAKQTSMSVKVLTAADMGHVWIKPIHICAVVKPVSLVNCVSIT